VLQPYDAILIKRQQDWQLHRIVAVQGEVKFPGPYVLTTKTERLSDVLKRAGGLTDGAYAAGIVFVRSRNSVGRIGVDLPDVLRDERSPDNIQLVDGDSIFIPQYASVVSIRGAVNNPVSVAWVKGASIDYYVRAAGGQTIRGDFDRAYVMQPSGKLESKHRTALFWTAKPTPQPGSTVVVPEKDPTDKRDWLAIATAATSILGSLVALSAIIKR
jgi:protein involved in polysaccharide export with SLBB domain